MTTGTAPLAHRAHDESGTAAARPAPSRREACRSADSRGYMTAAPSQADAVGAPERAARSEAR
jgi:hypothetical protein